MSHVLRVGVTDQIAYFRAFNDDGTAKTDLTSSTTGITLSVFRVGLAAVSISSLSDKAADSTTHADGAIRPVAGNLYTVDLPDAACADQTPSVGVRGSYTGGVIEPVPHPIVNYNPALVAVGANTTTPPTADQIMGGLVTGSQPAGSLARFVRDIKQSDVLFEGTIVTATSDTATLDAGATTVCVGQAVSIGEEGDTERQTRFVVAFNASTKVVTLDQPWCVVPDDGAAYQIKTQRNPLVGRLTGAIASTFGGLIANVATMIEDVSGWRFNAKALEEGPTGSGGGSINILPAVGIVADRSPGATITPVIGETISQSITLYATDGTTAINLSGKTLAIVFETMQGADVATVANANITVSGAGSNVVTFAYPSGVTASERTLRFAIRDAAAPLTLYLQGLCVVTRAPQVDP